MQQEIGSLLGQELGEGEEIQWSNRPERGGSAGPANVFMILVLIFGCIGFAMLIVAIILLTVVHTKGSTIASIPLFIVSGTFLFLTLLFGIFSLVYRQVPRNTLYAITNQRIMILRTGPVLTVDSYSRNDIGYLTRRERPDGSGDLFFTNLRSPYSYSYNNGYGNNGYSYGYGSYGMSGTGRFIGISNVRSVEQILRTTFKVDR